MKKEILKLSEVSGVNWHEEQFQVIAGNEVNAVYKALENKGIPTDDTRETDPVNKRGCFQDC